MRSDTIAAIATAMSPSGIGIVRISGEDAFAVADRIYKSGNGKKHLSECESHTIHYGFIYDGSQMIDEVMVILMRAPRSYTAEDTVEIDCHGGVYVMQRILDAALHAGARCADPGEFTKRAFLNGRLDLTQAEAVIDVIQSKNSYALKSSLSQLRGSVQEEVKQMRKVLIHELAFLESALDDPEHVSLEGYGSELYDIVDNLLIDVEKLLATFENGRIFREGINTVIVGKPNVGKSSLLNLLIGQERAIVTNIAGTTRDVLQEQIILDGIILNIMDTAGIRDTDNPVEKIGVDRAKEYLFCADLIIYVIDASCKLDDADFEIMEMLKEKKVIVLLNKSDLESVVTIDQIRAYLKNEVISFSTKECIGMEKLQSMVKEMFFHGELGYNDESYAINVRQKKQFEILKENLISLKCSIEDHMPEDFYSIDLMGAYEALGVVIGEAVEDDLVEEIFSKFCMGK